MWKATRFEVDYESFFSQHDVVYQSPVEPYEQKPGENFIDGPLLGNGDVGAVAHGTPDEVLINVGKNDVWDRRDNIYKLTRQPLTQAEFVDMIIDDKDDSGLDKLSEISKELHAPYDKPYPCPKPCGQIIFSNPELAGARKTKSSVSKANSFNQRLSLYDALLLSEFEKEKKKASISTFVAAEENLLLSKYAYEGEAAFSLTVDLYRWNDKVDETMTSPTFGCDGNCFWIRYRFPEDSLYPEGFEYVMLGAIKGAKYETTELQNKARATIHGEKSCEMEIYVSVATSRDAQNPFEKAKRIVKESMGRGYESILSKHKDWWHSFWSESFIDLSDDFMENLWYLNQYFLACCSKKGKVAPGLYGNWITNDSSSWHGDYHLNYNFQQQYWGVYAGNHLELASPYYDFIYRILPMAKKEARDIYNCRGAKYPLTAYPTKMDRNPYPVPPWDRCMCMSAWAAQGFWWHYQYTKDLDFLKEKAYPVIYQCARFYQDFMKKEEGKYVIWPTVSPEHHGITRNFELNKNCTIDLALIKFLLKATIEASQILDVDEKEREVFKEMLSNIADYPTCQTSEGMFFVDVENASPITYNVPVPVAPVVPGEDIGMDSPKEQYEIAKNTAEKIKINGNDGYIILPIAWMRLGLKEKYETFREWTVTRVRHNGALGMYPSAQNSGPVVENFAFTAVINEMLLQSYNGKIRVFPSLPDTMEAKIANLRAAGAFLVSAEIDKGDVKYIAVKSLKGSICTVVIPWEGEEIGLRDMTEKKELKDISRKKADVTAESCLSSVTFNTKTGHLYVIDRKSKPFESFPMMALQAGLSMVICGDKPACSQMTMSGERREKSQEGIGKY